MELDDFIDEVFCSFSGQFHGINLHDAVGSDILDTDTNRKFFERWIEATENGHGSDEPLDYLDTATSTNVGGVQIFHQKSKIYPDLNCTQLATTFNAVYLDALLSNPSRLKLAPLINKLSLFDPLMSDRELDDYEQEIFDLINRSPHSDSDGLIEVDLVNPIKGGAPTRIEKRLIWFTSHDDGYNEAAPWGYGTGACKRADLMRDVLGLVHFGSDGSIPRGGRYPHLLATMIVPVSSIPTHVKMTRPTPLDGVGQRYKSNFGDLRKKPQGWGRTADLNKFTEPRPHRGGRECITENFIPTGPVKFAVLGFTRVPRGDWTPENNNQFLSCLLRKRDKMEIATRLKGFSA